MKKPIRSEMKRLGIKTEKLQRKLFRGDKQLRGIDKPFYSIFYVSTLIDPQDEEKAEKAHKELAAIKKEKRRGAKTSSHPHKRRQPPNMASESTETQLHLDF